MRELENYLADPGYRFTVALSAAGTAFRQRVWAALSDIPRGESRTYGEIARLVGSAPRAVGQACGANPIALIIPSHPLVAPHASLAAFITPRAARSPPTKPRL